MFNFMKSMRVMFAGPMINGEMLTWHRDTSKGRRKLDAEFPRIWRESVPKEFVDDTRRAN
jgi:hypothetical protein